MPDLSFISSIVAASESLLWQQGASPRNAEQTKLRVNWKSKPIGVTLLGIPTRIQIQGSPDDSGVISGLATPVNGDGAVIPAGLAVGSTVEAVAFGAFPFRIGGANKNKAADAVGVVFDEEHKVAIDKFGAIAVNINAAGTINTQINSAAQTDTLSHDSALIALQKVQSPSFLPPTDFIRIGYILIANDGTLWTANTDSLTDDVDSATFIDITSSYHEIAEYSLDANDIARNEGTFFLSEKLKNKYFRLFYSSITGTVEITSEADFVAVNLD